VEEFLKMEGIRIVARDLAAGHPRKVYYFPATGRVLVKRLRSMHNDTVLERETEYRQRLTKAPESGDVELFV
jgi:chemotaxis protein CheD